MASWSMWVGDGRLVSLDNNAVSSATLELVKLPWGLKHRPAGTGISAPADARMWRKKVRPGTRCTGRTDFYAYALA